MKVYFLLILKFINSCSLSVSKTFEIIIDYFLSKISNSKFKFLLNDIFLLFYNFFLFFLINFILISLFFNHLIIEYKIFLFLLISVFISLFLVIIRYIKLFYSKKLYLKRKIENYPHKNINNIMGKKNYELSSNKISKINNFTVSLLIFFLAIFLKFSYFLYTDGFNRIPIQDAAAYFNLGKEIFENGYLTEKFLAGRPPLLPSLIAIFFFFFNENIILGIVRIFLIIITSAIPVIFYFICLNINLERIKAIFISLILLFYPPSIYYSSFLLTENLASLLISIIILLITFLNRVEKKNLLIILISFLFGLLTFSRSIFVALPFFIFLVYLISMFIKKDFKKFFGKFIFFILIYLVSISPWAIFNKIKHNEFIITTNRLGYMIYLSNSDLKNLNISQGQYEKSKKFLKNLLFARNNLNYKEESKYLTKLAINEITKNISLYPEILINRIINTLNSRPNPYKSTLTINDFIMLLWVPILILFIKYIMSNKLNNLELFMFILILYVILTTTPFWGTPRFRFPIDNLIIYFAIKELFTIKFKKE